MFALHVETLLLQCATGALAWLLVTRRHADVSAGYSWVVRGVAGLAGLGAVFFALRYDRNVIVAVMGAAVVAITAVTNGMSWVRGSRRPEESVDLGEVVPLSERLWRVLKVREYVGVLQRSTVVVPSEFDIAGSVLGMVGVISGGVVATDVADPGPLWLSIIRVIAGAFFLGAVIDLVAIAHWYLAQADLSRRPLIDMVDAVGWTSVPLAAVLLIPPGMASVLVGTLDDGYNGMLGWFWAACALTTIALVFVLRAVLRESGDSAIMAAIGLIHIILLTALGTALVASAILAIT